LDNLTRHGYLDGVDPAVIAQVVAMSPAVVRHNVGYYRYDTPRELDLLNQLWPLVSIQVNLFLP